MIASNRFLVFLKKTPQQFLQSFSELDVNFRKIKTSYHFRNTNKVFGGFHYLNYSSSQGIVFKENFNNISKF